MGKEINYKTPIWLHYALKVNISSCIGGFTSNELGGDVWRWLCIQVRWQMSNLFVGMPSDSVIGWRTLSYAWGKINNKSLLNLMSPIVYDCILFLPVHLNILSDFILHCILYGIKAFISIRWYAMWQFLLLRTSPETKKSELARL